MEILRNFPKLCGNYASPKNFHTRKLGKTAVFYAGINSVLDLFDIIQLLILSSCLEIYQKTHREMQLTQIVVSKGKFNSKPTVSKQYLKTYDESILRDAIYMYTFHILHYFTCIHYFTEDCIPYLLRLLIKMLFKAFSKKLC